MDNKQLKTFLNIATLQSFTLAAQNLNYAQSTITTQIKLLEKELNVKLFERLGHNISLTQEGRKLVPFARQILKLSVDAKSVINSSSNELVGMLSIGAVESLCVMRLPRILKEYRRRYPKVEIALKSGNRVEFLNALKENTIDIGFFLEKEINNEEFITEIKIVEPMVLIAAPENPLVRKKGVLPEDLMEQSLILTDIGCSYRKLFETMLNEYNIKPSALIETGNLQLIKQLAMSGMGITLLPMIAIQQECNENKLAILKWKGPKFELFTQVIYHKNKWMSQQLIAFIEIMREMKL